MDLTSGAPYWPLKNGLMGVYPPLLQDETCDVAVIGGGITGALCAYHLTAAGLNVVLLDKRDIGFGSTCASTALLLYELDTDLVDLIDLVGESDAREAYQLCRSSIDKIENLVQEIGDDCGFVRSKSLYLASRQRDVEKLQREFEARLRAGFKVEYFNAHALRNMSSLPHHGAILSHDAAQVDAFRLTHKLLEKSVQVGLRVYDRTDVTGYENHNDGISIGTARGPVVRAKKVTFATGYEVHDMLKEPVVELLSTYAIVTEPLASFAGWPEKWLLWETARPYLYIRPTADGRAMVGGEDVPWKNAAARDALCPEKSQALLTSFHELFPAIKTEVAFAWCGTFGMTSDSLAYIGETGEFPNAYFALGFGGNGITFSVIAAEIIRDACLGVINPAARLFRFGR